MKLIVVMNSFNMPILSNNKITFLVSKERDRDKLLSALLCFFFSLVFFLSFGILVWILNNVINNEGK